MTLFFLILTVSAVIFIYLRWLRPYLASLPHLQSMYANADTFWQRALVKFREWWDAIVAIIVAAAPQALDVLSQIQVLDLSALAPSETTRVVMVFVGLGILVARILIMRSTAKLDASS